MTSLTKILYFHHVFVIACNYICFFHWHFPLQLIPCPTPPESRILRQSVVGFTASGKMILSSVSGRSFQTSCSFLHELKYHKSCFL